MKYLISLCLCLLSASWANAGYFHGDCPDSLKEFTAPRDHDGYEFKDQPGAKASLYCRFSSDGILDKPILVSEGFDFMTHVGYTDMTGYDLWKMVNSNGDAQRLVNQGYDFILVDYGNALLPIQANALVFEEVIRSVNKQKTGLYTLSVVGVSMGGLVTRQALNFMEYEGIDHNTGLYVSYDTPHGCANVPDQLQLRLSALDSDDFPEAKTINQEVLNSPAALQMLCTRNDKVLNIDSSCEKAFCQLKNIFKNDLNRYSKEATGYPEKPLKVAFSNGDLRGYESSTINTLLFKISYVRYFLGEKFSVSDTAKTVELDTLPGGTSNWLTFIDSILNENMLPVGASVESNPIETNFVSTLDAIGITSDQYLTTGQPPEEYWVQRYNDFASFSFSLRESFPEVKSKSYFSLAVENNLFDKVFYESNGKTLYKYDLFTNFLSKPEGLLESVSPFDQVYGLTRNAQHTEFAPEHSDKLVTIVEDNTKVRIELVLPSLLNIIL